MNIARLKTVESVLEACRLSGQVFDKMVLIGQNGASRRLSAMIDVLMVAEELSERGDVILVESCNTEFISVFFDLDLMIRRGDAYEYYDVTTVKSGKRVGSYRIAHESKMATKYSVLKSKPFEHTSFVVGLIEPTVIPEFEIELPSEPCQIPFKQLDVMMDQFSKESTETLKECVRVLSQKLPDESSKYAKSGPQVKAYHGDLESAIRFNNRKSQEELEQFWDNLESHQRDFFSADFIESTGDKVKPMCRVPYSERAECPEFLPFMQSLDSSLAFASSLCVDDEYHPTELEWSRCNVNDPFVGQFSMRRVPDSHGSFDQRVFSLKGDWTELSYSGPRVKAERDMDKLNILSGPELEDLLETLSDAMLRPAKMSLNTQLAEQLITETYSADRLGQFTKKVMLSTLYTEANNYLMDYYEMLGDVSRALLSCFRSFKYHKGKNLIQFVKVEGRPMFLVVNKTGPSEGGSNMTVAAIGILRELEPTGYLIARHRPQRCHHFNVSPEDLDWWPTLWSKSLSWLSLMQTQLVCTSPEEAALRNDFLGMVLLLSNDEPFSQLATAVRFMYVNITGFGTNLSDIYKKLKWFRASSFAERLFAFRCLKMTTFGLLARSRNCLPWVKGVSNGQIPVKRIGFAIALPHQTTHVNSMNNVYNSFYLGKFLEYIRSNTIQKEAGVFLKMVENHLDYLENSAIPDADLAFSDLPLLEKFKLFDTSLRFGSHRPSALVVGLATELSKRRLAGKNLDLESVSRSTRVSDGFNSRGSVCDRGESNVCRDNIVVREKKKVRLSQVSKCYLTLSQNMLDFSQDRQRRTEELTDAHEEREEPQRVPDSQTLFRCLSVSDVAVNVIAFNQIKDYQYVARIFAKPEPGIRDIAILNSYMRLGCLYLENVARKIQQAERASGDHTNLIEQPDKDEIAMKTYVRTEKSKGIKFYDNEDHSSWGPTTSLVGLYIALGSRVKTSMRSVIRSILSSFSRKVSKIPEKLREFSKNNSSFGGNVVGQAMSLLLNGFKGFHRDRDCFETNEGMYQGTLGCCSSVLAADVHRLTTEVLEVIFSSEKLRRTGHLTSDDWCTAYSFENPTEMSMYQRVRRCTDVTSQITAMGSMKRNLVKSTPSGSIMELNSNFYTREGPQKPSARARLSYSIFSQEGDLSGSAMSICSSMSEYLRSESSVLGASWIGIISAVNHSLKFGLRRRYTQDPRAFKVPLELGGLPCLDPLTAVAGNQLLPYIGNYRNGIVTAAIMSEPTLASESTDLEDQMKSAVPTFSRYGVTNLRFREKRGVRLFRELLMALPREFWSAAQTPGRGSRFIKVIMGCLQRQEATMGGLSQREIQLRALINHDSEVFRVDSGVFQAKLGRMSSLNGLLKQWDWWLREPMTVEDEEVVINGVNLSNSLSRELGQILELEFTQLQKERRRIKPLILDVSNPPPGQAYELKEYYLAHQVHQFKQSFSKKFLPAELGGSSEIHPLLYLETWSVLNNRLRKLSRRVQKFWFGFPANKADRSLLERILSTNFGEGARLSYELTDSDPSLPRVPLDHLGWIIRNKGLRIERHGPMRDVLQASRGSHFDITKLIQLSRQFDNMSRTEMTSIIGAIQSLSRNSDEQQLPIFVDFWELRMGNISESFKSRGIRYEFCRKLTPDENYYMVSTPKAHGWLHEVLNLGDTIFPESSGSDAYEVAMVDRTSATPVELAPFEGMIWLKCHGIKVLPLCIDPLTGTTVFTISPPRPTADDAKWLMQPVGPESVVELLNFFIEPQAVVPNAEDDEEDMVDMFEEFSVEELVAMIKDDGEDQKGPNIDLQSDSSDSGGEEETQISVSSRNISGVSDLQYERALSRRACWTDWHEDHRVIKIRIPISMQRPPDPMTLTSLREWVESQSSSDKVWLKEHILRAIRSSIDVEMLLSLHR